MMYLLMAKLRDTVKMFLFRCEHYTLCAVYGVLFEIYLVFVGRAWGNT